MEFRNGTKARVQRTKRVILSGVKPTDFPFKELYERHKRSIKNTAYDTVDPVEDADSGNAIGDAVVDVIGDQRASGDPPAETPETNQVAIPSFPVAKASVDWENIALTDNDLTPEQKKKGIWITTSGVWVNGNFTREYRTSIRPPDVPPEVWTSFHIGRRKKCIDAYNTTGDSLSWVNIVMGSLLVRLHHLAPQPLLLLNKFCCRSFQQCLALT